MHTLFIYNYLQICKAQTVPFLLGTLFSLGGGPDGGRG